MRTSLKALGCSFILLLIHLYAFSQQEKYRSWNPATSGFDYIGGQAWPMERQSPYDRLPANAEKYVRKDVWDLSRHTAGIFVQFRSNASFFQVRYTVSGVSAFPHMPATGVSGVDLYSRTGNGPWLWSAGRFSFKDTITYTFEQLTPDSSRTFTLYFPLYNQVKWMEVRVPEPYTFEPLKINKDKPVVVYGTSIAQGGCATRPGLAWTSLLGRMLDRPVINLGFSGNGRMETELIDRIADIDAGLIILDCLPNMVDETYISGELEKRLIAGIQTLRKRRPLTPILLSEHAGYTHEVTSEAKKAEYRAANVILDRVYESLVGKGMSGLHLLKKESIGQNIESMVDGVHPNDIGMMYYANAYADAIRMISLPK